jgi:glycerol-3-phosphate dehydrogenase
MVVNRARPPGDGDIIVPGGNSSIIGTTSSPGTDLTPTREEVDLLVEEAAVLFPHLRDMRLLRAYSGVRPLIGGNGDGRDASRSHRVVTGDNIVAVLGGKLTTFRSMAEQASNEVCMMLGNVEKCTTGTEPLPDLTGGEYAVDNVCGCEGSTLNLPEKLLPLLGTAPHRFAGTGFGPCQGWRCLAHGPSGAAAERWRGLRPVLHRGQFKQGYMLWARQRGMEGK